MTHAGAAEKPFFRHGRPTAAIGIGLLLVVFLVTRMTSASALAPVNLGTAASFAVLAGTGVTNTPPTLITGNLGTCPTPSITGSPTVIGTIYQGSSLVCDQAKLDLVTAYNDAALRAPPTATYSDAVSELGGQTLVEGTYKANTAFGITGALRLDAQGNSNAVFIFQMGSTLGTAVNSSVILENGALACNVFWQVGSSATLGSTSTFVGTIMALTTITANSGATVQGRLLARNGAVNLNNNVITRPTCAQTTTSTTTGGGATTTALPTSTTTGGGATTTALPTSTTTGGGGGATTTALPTSTTTGAAVTTTSRSSNTTLAVAVTTTQAPNVNTTVRPTATTSRVGAPVPSAGGQGTAPAAGGGSGGSATATTLNARTGTATLPRTGPSSASTQLTAALAAIVTGGVMVLLGSRRRRCVSDD